MNDTYSTEEYKYYLIHGKFPENNRNAVRPINEGIFINPIYQQLLEMVNKKQAIFIPGNVPSSKNSREIKSIYTGKSDCCNAPYLKLGNRQYQCTACNKLCNLGRRNILAYSDICQNYVDTKGDEFVKNKAIFDSFNASFPIDIGLYFIRSSRHIFDGINAAQILFDLMQKYKWVNGDDMDHLRHHDLGYHLGDNPGVIIAILDFTPKFNTFNIIKV